MSTRSTLPSEPAKSPLMTFTLSPTRTLMLRILCFCRRSLARWTASILLLRCSGALRRYLRCFLGLLLDFHADENGLMIASFFRFFFGCLSVRPVFPALHHHAGYLRDCRPPLRRFLGDRPFEERPLWVALVILQQDRGVVLELDAHAVRAPVFLPLPHDDGEHGLLPHIRPPSLDGHHDEVADACGSDPAPDRLRAHDREYLDDLRPGIVAGVNLSAERDSLGDVRLDRPHCAPSWLESFWSFWSFLSPSLASTFLPLPVFDASMAAALRW